MLTATHNAGLHLILYMTNDPSHHNETGFEYLDSGAYSTYKHQNIDITTTDGFDQFSYDNFIEVMNN